MRRNRGCRCHGLHCTHSRRIGDGKELVARTIHRLSPRVEHTMVNINCTAIPEHLLESELFGHVKGAFTGADKPRQGLFMAADGSSLHLDEIGDLPLQLQPKLLRALQEREIRPVGGTENIPVNVRILASTNQRLETRILDGTFREDLYYRLNVLTQPVPSLRDRPSDIPLLALHCLRETCRELGNMRQRSQRGRPGIPGVTALARQRA